MRIGDGLHVFGAARDARGRASRPARSRDARPRRRARRPLRRRRARRRAVARAASTCCRPGATSIPSIRAPCRPAPPGSSASAPAKLSLAAYVQDHGEWPRRIVFDLWGSATMRTGGEDLAQALCADRRAAAAGTPPPTASAATRCCRSPRSAARASTSPCASPGLFRDVFPEQIALFHAAAEAVAARDDETTTRTRCAARRDAPSACSARAPGAYGTGVARAALGGDWETPRRTRRGLSRRRRASPMAAPRRARARRLPRPRRRRRRPSCMCRTWPVRTCSTPTPSPSTRAASPPPPRRSARRPRSTTSTRPMPEQPQGAHAGRGGRRASCAPAPPTRAGSQGQMRHGHRGAAEIAETVDNLYLFAATTDVVADRHFDLLFDARLRRRRGPRLPDRAPTPQAAAAIADRFAEALRRGLWTTRRNSVEPPSLAGACGGAA